MTDKNHNAPTETISTHSAINSIFFLSKHQSLVLVVLVYSQDRHKFDHALTLTIDSESFH